MRPSIKSFSLIFLLCPVLVFSQQDTLIKKLDSLSVKDIKENQSKSKNNNITPSAYNDSTKFTLHNYFVLLASDIKQQIRYPFHANKKDWKKVALFGAVATGLAFADESVSSFFVGLAQRNNAVSSASSFITRFGGTYEIYALAGLTTYGFIFKNEKIKSTAFLASQAYITAGAFETVIKFLTNRQRPNYIDPKENASDPVFHGPFYKYSNQPSGLASSSFPSGHTTAVFAAATVYAMEYRDHPWVPIFSYSFATLVGISRLTQDAHWPTDVLLGAALGILCGRQVVNNYHRFMKIKEPMRPVKQRKGTIGFSLQPVFGKLLPGLTYSFH